MADPIIKVKRSSVSGKVPTPTDLLPGELAVNTTDGLAYLERSSGITTVVNINPWGVGIGSTGFDINYKRGHVAVGTDLHVSILTVGDVGDFVPWRGALSVKTTPSSGTVAESAIYLEEQVGNEGWYMKINSAGDLIFNNSGSATESFEFMDNDDLRIRKGHVGILTDTAADALVVNGNAKVVGVATIQGNISLDAGLYDINDSLGTDTQVLTSTGAGVSWSSASGGASALNDLTDVTITSAAQDNILRYTGSAWINDTNISISGVSTFAGLTTVTGPDLFAKQVNVSGATTFYGDVSFTGATYTLLWDASENALEFPDNAQFRFGDSADMVFYHNGFNSIIVDQGGGDLYLAGDANIVFTNSATTETKAKMTSDGPVELYFDNVKKFETSSAGVLVSGQTTTTTLNVTGVSTFGGNVSLDAGLYDINNSLGSDTYVLTSTGAGVSWTAGGSGITTEKHITVYGSGTQTNTTEVTVDLDTTGESSGTGDFTVSATGVVTVLKAGRYLVSYSITTDITTGSARSGCYAYLRLNGSGEVTASRSYTYNRISTVGADTMSKQIVMNLAANDTLEVRSVRYAGTDTTVVVLDYSTITIHSIEGLGGISVGGGGGASALNDLTDVTISGASQDNILRYTGSAWINDTTINLSGIATFQNKVHLLDNDILHFGGTAGASGDLQIYHSGSFSYIQDVGTGGLILTTDTLAIKNAADTANLARFIESAECELYYNGSEKFATTNTGVNVVGTVVCDGLTVDGTSTFNNLADFNSTLRDVNNSVGTDTQVLTSTGTGVSWSSASGGASALNDLTDVTISAPSTGQVLKYSGSAWINDTDATGGAGGGDGGWFNTGITTTVYHSVNAGIGGNQTETNDWLRGPGIALTFPATASKGYIVESIQVVNIHTADLYLVARHDYNGGEKVPITQRIVVPYQGAVELLDIQSPIIANPSDEFGFQALDGLASTANGVNNGMELFFTYSTKDSALYVGIGSTVQSSDQPIYTASANTVVESVAATNLNLSADVAASISIFRGGVRLGYLCKDLNIPKNSTVNVIARPKYLANGDSIRATSGTADSLAVRVSGKKYS